MPRPGRARRRRARRRWRPGSASPDSIPIHRAVPAGVSRAHPRGDPGLGRAQACERLLAPEDGEDLEERRRRRAPGQRQTRELGQVDELEPERLAQLTVQALQRFRGDAGQRLEPSADRREPGGARLREVHLRRLRRVATGALEVEATDVEQLAKRLSSLLERLQRSRDVRVVSGRLESDGREERTDRLGEARRAHPHDVLVREPFELRVVEDGAGGGDIFDVEELDQLLPREDLLVPVGPAEPGQVVDHGVGRNAGVAERLDGGRAVALGEPAPVRPQDHRHVRHLGDRVAERLVAEDLLRRVRQVVVAANHVRDPHRDVVHDDAEVVRGRAVRADEDPVVEPTVVERDRAVDQVVHDRRARVRDPEAERPGIQAAVAAPPRVAESLLARLGGPPLALQELGRAVAVVGAARGAQSLGVVTVDRKPLGLAVARRRRPLVPVEAEPLEGLEDRGDVLVGRARTVGVLDPEDEGPAVVARVEPVEQRGARAPDVEVSRRARLEAHTDGAAHVRTTVNGALTTSGSRPGFSRRHSTSTSGGAPPLHPDTPHRSPRGGLAIGPNAPAPPTQSEHRSTFERRLCRRSSAGFARAIDPYTASVASRRSGERRLACRGEKQEEETRRPSMAAKGLLTRGPKRSEPPEAHPQSVPVGKRTALKVQEKVAPRRAGIRATCRSRSAAASAVPKGGGPVRYHLGVDWADQTHAVWVVDERGTKITARTVPHTAEGLSEWGRELDEWRAHANGPWAAGVGRQGPGGGFPPPHRAAGCTPEPPAPGPG